jgi:hypothetical protein
MKLSIPTMASWRRNGQAVSMNIGTLAWGGATRGQLRNTERLLLALQGVRAVARTYLPSGRTFSPPGLAKPPDTALARRVDELLVATSPPWLVNHGRRTYVWAMALAQRDDLCIDGELLYAASQLHDLGLLEAYAPAPGECFAMSGARAAEEALREAGMPATRARVVGEAIALHLNLRVALERHGPEAHLLRAAAALDVVGQDAKLLTRTFRDLTLAEIPRMNFKEQVIEAVEAQSVRSPHTRIGFACKALQLCSRIRAAPFPS